MHVYARTTFCMTRNESDFLTQSERMAAQKSKQANKRLWVHVRWNSSLFFQRK